MNRLDFIKALGWFAGLPFLVFAGMTVSTHQRFRDVDEVRIPQNINNGIPFFGQVIIYKANENLKAFSSACPHLGCQIQEIVNSQLVCPCHGSKFTIDGKPISGPAKQALKELEYEIDDETTEIVVKV